VCSFSINAHSISDYRKTGAIGNRLRRHSFSFREIT
jgi:hypothetical protein